MEGDYRLGKGSHWNRDFFKEEGWAFILGKNWVLELGEERSGGRNFPKG